MSWLAFYSMTTTVVVFAFVNVNAQSLSCYNCLKVDTTLRVSRNESTTCPKVFDSQGVNTCEGKACLIIVSEFENRGSMVNVSCLTTELDHLIPGGVALRVSGCDFLNRFQNTQHFYQFDGMCCTTRQSLVTQGVRYNETFCACDSSRCNKNITSFQLNAEPTMAIQTTVAPPSTMSICHRGHRGLIPALAFCTAALFL